MFRPNGGRLSDSMRLNPSGIKREFTEIMEILYGRVLTRDKTVAFEAEYGGGALIVTVLVVGFRVMLTVPELEAARPVVWKRVVMRTPDVGI